MTKRDLTEVNDFVSSMGGRSLRQIPVVYMEDSQDLVIEKNGVKTNKKQRYDSGKDVIFQCSGCEDIIGSGRKTEDKEDVVKIYCYKCKSYHYHNGAIIWSKNVLWHKPETEQSRLQFESLMKQFIDKKHPETIRI